MCRNEACLEQKFVVFGSELDLRAHTIETVSFRFFCLQVYQLTFKHKGQMTSRQQAASRHLNLDFSDQSQSRGTSSRSTAPAQGGRGFTLQSREVVQQQQLAEHAPMGGAQAAQARRQAQTDRQEESNRRRKAFNTNLTETQREPEPEVRGGFSGPREDVDEATAL
jgi:hypothetical protein